MNGIILLKTILMNKKLHDTTSVCVEIMNSKRQVNEKLSHLLGTNSRLPFDVNVRFNLSIIEDISRQGTGITTRGYLIIS